MGELFWGLLRAGRCGVGARNVSEVRRPGPRPHPTVGERPRARAGGARGRRGPRQAPRSEPSFHGTLRRRPFLAPVTLQGPLIGPPATGARRPCSPSPFTRPSRPPACPEHLLGGRHCSWLLGYVTERRGQNEQPPGADSLVLRLSPHLWAPVTSSQLSFPAFLSVISPVSSFQTDFS